MSDEEFHQIEAELFDEFGLPLQGIYGAPHWRRVDAYGRLIAAETGADLEVVRRFALFHDCQRFCEQADPGHGFRGAQRARQFFAEELSEEQMQLLWLACEGHERGFTTPDPTVGTCWDADRLDHDRLGIRPSFAYMSTVQGETLSQMSLRERQRAAGIL